MIFYKCIILLSAAFVCYDTISLWQVLMFSSCLWSRWQDVVVGAPQFYMKDGDVGGAVYVYINKAGSWEIITPVRLNGTKDSMFGLAVKNIGDVNLDSYKGNLPVSL